MKNAIRKSGSFLARALWSVAAIAGLVVVLGYVSGLRINVTTSMPRGLWLVDGENRKIEPGDVVTFCPPVDPVFKEALERGYFVSGPCPGQFQELMKMVVAVAGTSIDVTEGSVRADGQAIVGAPVLSVDHMGRSLPVQPAHQIVPDGMVWVMSTWIPQSFDSRYFGPVPVSAITARLRPLWVEGGAS